MKNHFFKKLIFLLFISLNAIAQDGKFSFNISSPVSTSAGVFKNDSILIRTLWNNVNYSAGTYTKYWDGKDDYGNAISSPASSYKIKVLSNNVKYIWQGTVGNTSDNQTGASKHRGYSNCMTGLSLGADFGYFTTGYSEGASSIGKFNINTPNVKIPLFETGQLTGNVNYSATDGINVYWGVQDAFSSNNTFVFGSKVSDDAETNFTSGVSYTVTYGKRYIKTIANVNAANAVISALAVQKTGIFLFVARKDLNQLQVLNKTTGALLQTLTYTNVRGLSVDNNNSLWMITAANTVAKYTINGDGTLTSPTLTLYGLVSPLVTQVSTDGTLVTVADGGSSQQIKFYNNSTGSLASTLGTAGGYLTDATVSNSKFYFNENDVPKNARPFIAYQADGSFWVNDAGNSRAQHYNAGNTFINRIMFLGSSYSTWVDKNNINRAFVRYLEFAIDYGVQNLTGSTGWSLVKNWGAVVGTAYNDQFQTMKPVTLTNGKTYALIQKGDNSEVVELTSTGTLRFTGILKSTVSYNSYLLCSDGSLQLYNEAGPAVTYKRYALTGFDASNNPQWATTAEILASGTLEHTVGNPIITPKNQIFSTTDKMVMYNYKSYSNNAGPVLSSGYHLGLMQKGANNTYLFQTEKSTRKDYKGPFPPSGWFDVGNDVNDYSGGNVNIIDRNIITSYHGEFWKASQANKYNHYYDNGLAIGQFGTTRPEVGFGNHAAAMMAGNALTPVVVKDANGDLYLYHGDESDHSGMHRWKITGLNSIAEQVVTIPFPSAFSKQAINYIDLMEGLPFEGTLATNTAGWTRNPATDVTTGFQWGVKTGVSKYDIQNTTDIYINFAQAAAATYDVSRDLGTNSVTTNWKISGNVNLGNMPNGLGNNAYMEVLDVNGKVLTTMYGINDHSKPIRLFGNTVSVLASALPVSLTNTNPFDIILNNGVVNFTYGGYAFAPTTISDPTGDWKKPKTLRIRFTSTPGMPNAGISYDVSDLKFYKDFSGAVPANIAPVANAGADNAIQLPVNNAMLTGSATDADGTISSYAWAKTSGPASGTISTANTATSAVNSLVQGVYQYELTVTDNTGATGKKSVQITVNAATNQIPVANAGANNIITLPASSTSLTGSGTDADGTINNYAWVKIAGPAAGTIATSNAATTVVNNMAQGVYQYELTVTDNAGATGKATVQVTVNSAANQVPVANAGTNTTITLPVATATLSGNGTDADGTINSYAWVKIAGPVTGTIETSNAAVTAVNNMVQGIYQYELTVTDNTGATGKATVQVTVNAAAVSNLLPAVNPANTVNGLDYKYYEGNWNVLPAFSSLSPVKTGTTTNFNISLANRADQYGFSFTGFINVPADGQYTFYASSDDGSNLYIDNVLTVANDGLHAANDNSGTIGLKAGKHAITGFYFQQSGGQAFVVSYAGMGITKQAVPASILYRVAIANVAPVANAGTNKVIALPVSTITLTGSGTDSDGTVSSYAWVKTSGPASATISSASVATIVLDNLVQGVYQYQLTVTDNTGATGKATIQVTVNAAPASNLLPAVNPANTVNGLDYKYYEGNWNVLPAFASLSPVKSGATTNFNISLANRATQYGFSFTGFINVPADGQYTFYTSSDDGSNLYIDNVTVVANDGLHAANDNSGIIGLKAGKHAIKGLYFQQGGGQAFLVSYAGMGITKQAIPSAALYRSTAAVSRALVAPDHAIYVANELKVYPNPVKDIATLNVTTAQVNSKMYVSVSDMSGKVVKYKELVSVGNKSLSTIDLSNVRDGYYIITIKLEDGQKLSSKIVKFGGK